MHRNGQKSNFYRYNVIIQNKSDEKKLKQIKMALTTSS